MTQNEVGNQEEVNVINDRLSSKLFHCRKTLLSNVKKAKQLDSAKRARKLKQQLVKEGEDDEDNEKVKSQDLIETLQDDLDTLKEICLDKIVYIALRNKIKKLGNKDKKKKDEEENENENENNYIDIILQIWAEICLKEASTGLKTMLNGYSNPEHLEMLVDNPKVANENAKLILDSAISSSGDFSRVENSLLSSNKLFRTQLDALTDDIRIIIEKIPNKFKRSIKSKYSSLLKHDKNIDDESNLTSINNSIDLSQYDFDDGSEAEDDGNSSDDSIIEPEAKPKKNRMGQRARQALAEKKYGDKANHISKGTGINNTPLGKRKDLNDNETNDKNKNKNKKQMNNKKDIKSSDIIPVNNNIIIQEKDNNTQSKKENNNQKSIHPSWEAKKKAAEAAKLLMKKAPAAKKIVFNNDSDSD